ncbi:MAG: hypothetical protein IPL84_00235 [Chitinophagaceae bacterium]|nr:hypothetical protein [Chitinophagaceae bacterium]
MNSKSFSATDDVSNINSEIIFYRLKVVGKTGSVKYSNIVHVKKQNNNIDITLSPNLANFIFTVSFYAIKDTDASIWLFDNAGKKCFTKTKSF